MDRGFLSFPEQSQQVSKTKPEAQGVGKVRVHLRWTLHTEAGALTLVISSVDGVQLSFILDALFVLSPQLLNSL